MARDNTFTFRVNLKERRLIEQLSKRLERTQSDSIRWSLRKVAREMGVEARTGSTKTIELTSKTGIRSAVGEHT